MKKFILPVIMLLPLFTLAQNGTIKKRNQKVKDRIERHVEEGMDKASDKIEAEISKQAASREKTVDSEKMANGNTSAKAESTAATSFKSYSRYDFVPGENVLYAEDFSQDVIGEFPLKWATNNRGETVTIQGLSNKWMRMFIGEFVSPQLKSLPANFTVEFDLFLTYINNEEQNFGAMFPKFELQLLQLAPGTESARKYAQGGNETSKLALIMQPAYEDRSSVYIQSYYNNEMYFEGGNKDLKTFSDNYRKPVHVAIAVQKSRLRLWMNEEKVYDIPQAISPEAIFNHIGFWTADNNQEENVGVYVSNIKVAEGIPDMRHKLITEGKLTTTGILFDVNSDKIKPESFGVLKEIAAVLKENAAVRVKVIGHTDSDGDDAKNLELSKHRSAAVKAALATEFSIDASRMETAGMGETKPVADNATREGKAQNRRVEFIKL